MYLINKNEEQRLKLIGAYAFSATQWRVLKKLSECQPASIMQTV